LLCKFFEIFIAVLIIGCLAGCTASTPASVPFATATLATCQPSRIQTSKNDFPEIQGTMSSEGEMWALLFFDKAHAKEELKIVWRITGTGEQFIVQARHEDGTVISPIWGPEAHGGSNWDRPGDEWGTGFNFPKPGCWTLTATRGTTIGEISLNVLPP
jgi:hypothetical protein